MTVSAVGGAGVGLAAGYAVYRVLVMLNEHMTETVLTIILAYGSFLLAEHYLGVSGVIASVAAGLFIGNRGREYAMSARTKITVFNTWHTAAFIVNTFIFLVIGAQTPIRAIVANAGLLGSAVLLVLLGRALAVYPIVRLSNVALGDRVSRAYQHVLVWGGLHASIPIALALGLPADVPLREQMRVLVFGVAAFSLVVQGLTVRRLVEGLGITTSTDEERLYQLLVGRARAVDAVLDAAEELYRTSRISGRVYEEFTAEYEAELDDLEEAIGRLLAEHPELREREQLAGERQLLARERAAIQDAEHEGLISTDVAARLIDEVNIKLDRVQHGETTIQNPARTGEGEEFREFWRERAADYGLVDGETDDGDRSPDPAR
jgi:CPA1 family monovalent cation:H+ antiporter